MKAFLKKQFCTFPSGSRLPEICMWLFTVHLFIIGGISIWQGVVIDEVGWSVAGTWQIFAGLIYIMLINSLRDLRKSRKMFLDIIKRQQELLDESMKIMTEAETLLGEAEKIIEEGKSTSDKK